MIFGHLNRAVAITEQHRHKLGPGSDRPGESGSEFDTTGPALTRSARPGDRHARTIWYAQLTSFGLGLTAVIAERWRNTW